MFGQVIKRVGNIPGGISQIVVINGLRVLGSGPHTPTP